MEPEYYRIQSEVGQGLLFLQNCIHAFGNNVLEMTQCGVILAVVHGLTGILFAEVAELWTTPGRRTIIVMLRRAEVQTTKMTKKPRVTNPSKNHPPHHERRRSGDRRSRSRRALLKTAPPIVLLIAYY